MNQKHPKNKDTTPPVLPPEFAAMMHKVANTPKEEVDKVIAAEKKAKAGKRKDC